MGASPETSRGGAPAIVTRALYWDFAGVDVLDNTFTRLPWVYTLGTALLDVTTPTLPTVVTAGVYAVACAVGSTAGAQAGKFIEVVLDLDDAGDDAEVFATFPLDYFPSSLVSCVYYCPADAGIRLSVRHNVGASTNFRLFATVQRLS